MAKLKVDQAMKRAKAHMRKGEMAEARALYEAVLADYPKNERVKTALAELSGPVKVAAPSKGAASGTTEPPAEVFAKLSQAYQAGRLQDVHAMTGQLLSQYGNSAKLWNFRAAVSSNLNLLDDAEQALRQVVRLQPGMVAAKSNLGVILERLGKLAEAEECYRAVIASAPEFAEAHNNLGNILKSSGKLEEAQGCYINAIARKADYADAHYNLANTLRERDQLEDAKQQYFKTLKLQPKLAEAWYGLGQTLAELKSAPEAVEAYQRALAIKPGYVLAIVELLREQSRLCDWRACDLFDQYGAQLGVTGEAALPFPLLPFEDNPAHQLARSRNWAQSHFSAAAPVSTIQPTPADGRKIRLGYFSADFHDHATMFLMAGILRHHDRSKFEIFAFSYGHTTDGAQRDQMLENVDQFFDVQEMSDGVLVAFAREQNLDIAIDLKGYTRNSRLEPFAKRVAPLQISYLGYPGTLGADFIDYIIADPVVIPPEQRSGYHEKIIYLPGCYQPNDNTRDISNKPMTRAELGLPEDGFVFCCLNNNYKIMPAEFAIWMRVMKKVEGSVLWLWCNDDVAKTNLRESAEKHGVSGDRLIFAGYMPQSEHLARLRHADLFIDTFNVNAHTTASDALWAGLPVVTLAGKQFAARVAASLLSVIGLPELTAETPEAYEELILKLAQNPDMLADLRTKLDANRLTQPLFDTEGYTRGFEQGLEQAFVQRLAGEAFSDIAVNV
ncbi:tetratricopeptide repeat protein [Thalassospira sp. ER-Se-21-Dark]|uniref:O-linked N-acetylglucosamine transferase family protein n=1 Tax=Thalassospira sp. ER-Se-21-Dark TaxID=2585190 RepID=UPI001B3081F6|nr:tetratricopeptide repeat protein [Thalassospira sp. ER-Se-21-Dark]